ncbi:MAG: ankyrin repeat domain-containing protein [Alphaproteobacteria bacterium]
MGFLPAFNEKAYPRRKKALEKLIEADDAAGLAKFLQKFPKAVEWEQVFGPKCQTFIHLAVQIGNLKAAEVMLEHGARTDTFSIGGHTALETALNIVSGERTVAEPEHIRMAELLLKHGADVNGTDLQGRTNLSRAAWMGNAEAAQFLLDHGANPTIVLNGMTLLHDALMQREPCAKILKVLMTANPDVNVVNSRGMTPLFYAHEIEVARMLLDAGADPDHADNKGRTAWTYGVGEAGLRDFIQNYKAERAAEACRAEEQRDADIAAACHDGVPLPKSKPLVLKKKP